MGLSVGKIGNIAAKWASALGKKSILLTKPQSLKGINAAKLTYAPLNTDVFEKAVKIVSAEPVKQKIANAFKAGAELLPPAERKVFWANVKQMKFLKWNSDKYLEEHVNYITNLTKHKTGNIVERLKKVMPDGAQAFEKQNIVYSKKDYNRILKYQDDDTFARALRAGRELTKEEIEGINHIDTIIKNSEPLNKDMTVFRTVSDSFGFGSKLKVGAVIKDEAYLSTSMEWDGLQKMWNAPSSDKKFRLRILLPKGTKYMACNGTYKPLLGRQKCTRYPNELVIPRGSELLVKKIDDELNIVDMVLIKGSNP